jgi:hypothetical protein
MTITTPRAIAQQAAPQPGGEGCPGEDGTGGAQSGDAPAAPSTGTTAS